jgi:ribonuclease P protein component
MRAVRVRSRAQFAALRSAGRRSRRRAIQVTHLAAPDAGGPPAVAYAIGRPVGTAVVRNRLRRRLRAIVDRLDLPSGTYLISATPVAVDLRSDELAEQLVACVADLAATVRSGSPA